MLTSSSRNDLLFGLLILGLGALGFAISSPLEFGSTARMGPGFFPRVLCGVMVVIGAANVARAFRADAAEAEPGPPEPWAVRPMLGVTAAIAFFAYGIESLGLVASVAGAALLASAGDREARPVEALVLALGIAALAALIFVKAIGLAIPLWP